MPSFGPPLTPAKVIPRFEVWSEDDKGRATRKLVTTESWALANFFARLVSLPGHSMIIGEQVFDGDLPGDKTIVASYQHGRLAHFFAGAPGPPSIWP